MTPESMTSLFVVRTESIKARITPDFLVIFYLRGANSVFTVGANEVVWMRPVRILHRDTRHHDDGRRTVEVVNLQINGTKKGKFKHARQSRRESTEKTLLWTTIVRNQQLS
jgi:hypothetical protein